MKPLVQNAANVDQVKRAENKVLNGRDRELRDVADLLAMPAGRRFIWRYLSECGVFRTSWEASAKIHFNEGMRNIGLMMLADVNEANPDGYIQMMKESKQNETL